VHSGSALGFAEALAALHPQATKASVDSPSAVGWIQPPAWPPKVHVVPAAVDRAGCCVKPRLHPPIPGVVLYDNVQLAEGPWRDPCHAVLHPGSQLGAGCASAVERVIGAEALVSYRTRLRLGEDAQTAGLC